LSALTHTCVNTASTFDGTPPPPCVACGEQFKARAEAEAQVITAAVAFWRRRTLSQGRLLAELDAAIAKLVALGGGK
jgi:hypothetical protein